MSRFQTARRAFLVVVLLFLVVVVATAIPAMTLASDVPLPQHVSALTAQGAPDSAQDAVSGFLTLVIALVTGGALAYLFDDIPAWRNWKPQTAWLKSTLMLAATALVGAALVTLQTNILPQYFGGLPAEARTAIAWAAVYLSSQITHQYDVKAEAERALVRFQIERAQAVAGTVGKAALILALLALALAVPLTTQAAAPDEIQNYLNGEPALFCIAHDIGAPVEAVVAAKITFDNRFGAAHAYAPGDAAWAASYAERIQYFAGYLNTPNPLRADGNLTQGCARLVKAQTLLSALQ